MYNLYTCLMYFCKKRSNEVEYFIFGDLVFVVADGNYDDLIQLVAVLLLKWGEMFVPQ